MEFCNIRVDSPFFLSPMAAITSLPFRLMCKKQGAGLVITEQINATLIARNPDPFTNNEFFTIRTIPEEKPVGVQLFGTDEKDFMTAVQAVEKNFELININCGCPSHKETSIGAGAALLKNPDQIVKIAAAIKSVCSKPVTVKIRLGWDSDKSLEIAKRIENAGVDALMVHARTAEQGYSGKADWEAIAKIVRNLSIPVVANGDVDCAKKAREMLDTTGARFGLVGRCAMNNPFIFREINEFIQNGTEWKPTSAEKIGAFFEYYEMCQKLGMVKLTDIKLKAINLTRGIDFSKNARVRIVEGKSIEEIVCAVDEFRLAYA